MARSSPKLLDAVRHGIGTVDEHRLVHVPLRDLLFVHQTLGELVRFFHQPDHYPTIQQVFDFLGDVQSGGAFEAMHTAYYKKLAPMLPSDIQEDLANGVFEHPLPPGYYKEER